MKLLFVSLPFRKRGQKSKGLPIPGTDLYEEV